MSPRISCKASLASPPSRGDAGPVGAAPHLHLPALLPPQLVPVDGIPGLGLRRVGFLGGHTSVPENGLCLLWSGPSGICVLQTATRLWQRRGLARPSRWGARALSPEPALQATSLGVPAATSAVNFVCTKPCPHGLLGVIIHQRLSGKFIIS